MIGAQVGQFVIRRLLGESGIAMVYLAGDLVRQTWRVVKVLRPEVTRLEPTVREVAREVRKVAAIGHRAIVEVHQVGQLPDRRWFLLRDYVDGPSLASFVRREGGPMALDRIVRVACEIGSGLQAAHARGLVHGDLRPSNIYMREHEGERLRAGIVDFGVARLGARWGPAATAAFLASEQLRGHEVGPAADVFALGVLVYQMTTGGWLPYQDGEAPDAYQALPPAEIYHRQMSGPPIDPRRYAANATAAWAAAIAAALDVQPARRPPTVGAFVRMLAEAAPGDGHRPSGTDLARAYAGELLDHEAARLPPRASGSRYRLERQLGAGGMAEVFRGTTLGVEGFSRPVAIKRVLAEHAESPSFAAMFAEEARIASQLSHPNVVPVLDFDRDAEGRPFLVMELVEGKDLGALCAAGRPPPSVAIFVVSEILRGLGYAHALPHRGGARGYVHRDLSPHNVLVSWEGAVKVSDFGIAKALEASGGSRSGIAKGKPAYMSPEQVATEVLDGRSDLFAAGILLWELLAGTKLFAGGTRETFARILFQDAPRPSELADGVPADLEAVAMRLLARDREARYPTAEAAIEALARCADSPRDGRGELVRWMARSFPEEARRRERAEAKGGEVTRTDAGDDARKPEAARARRGVERPRREAKQPRREAERLRREAARPQREAERARRAAERARSEAERPRREPERPRSEAERQRRGGGPGARGSGARSSHRRDLVGADAPRRRRTER